MPREVFERHLRELQDEVLTMGSMVEKSLERAIDALKRRDLNLAQRVVEDDSEIDQKRLEIEEGCINLIATQQPMAGDLRILVAILNLATELERMGDYAEGIGRITLTIGDEPHVKPLIDVPRMSEIAIEMLRGSLKAFMDRDAEAARQISRRDDEVDMLYDQVFRELISFMLEDPGTITRATRLLWVAHKLERIADRTTNICERVVFVVTGELEEMGGSKY